MIKNCLGITTDDLKRQLLDRLDLWLLDWLLSLDCGKGGAADAALANYNAYSLYTAKNGLNYINALDASNGHLTGNDTFDFVKGLAEDSLRGFAQNECIGQNNAYKDLDNLYGGPGNGSFKGRFPNTASDDAKNRLLQWADSTNFGVGNNPNLGSGTAVPPYLLAPDGTNGEETLFDGKDSLFGDSALSRVPIGALESFDPYTVVRTKCFSSIFEIPNYFVPDDPASRPILTDDKARNLRRLHNEILLPIYRHYYGTENTLSCKMRVHGGLTTLKTAYSYLGASFATKHIEGIAVNFSLVSVSNDIILDDLRNRRIPVEFGYAAQVNGVFICLPFSFRGYDVRGVILDAANFDVENLDLDFV